MITLNETQLKPSIVLQAMVTGLLNSKNDPKFTVDMDYFGYVKEQLCYGCAATVTLVEMFGNGKSASELMLGHANAQVEQSNSIDAHLSDVLKLEPSIGQDSLPDNLKDFENAVDSARRGRVSWLIEFLTGEPDKLSFNSRWELGDHNWEDQLPIVEATIAEMIAAGY